MNGHRSRLSYGRSAYVTQDEVLIGTLTVMETIKFAAQLRLPSVSCPSCIFGWEAKLLHGGRRVA